MEPLTNKTHHKSMEPLAKKTSGVLQKETSASPKPSSGSKPTSPSSPRIRQRSRVRKRKRCESESSSDEESAELPESSQEVDRKLQETATRNNLSDDSVKKILKKVVMNDHVLALVKLREEEEEAAEDLRPKLTRAKAKCESESSSDEESAELPESSQEVDRKLQETATRNNFSDDSVKKILKKVVMNDHVLALVKLREEEEEAAEDLRPKLTRAKAKEMTRMSPTQAAPWTLALTPIKHIPVKTRPEVTSLIADDLPDESDEEYQPNPDEALSDDDQIVESCSDLDSQPHTPATPGAPAASPSPVSPSPDRRTDGPFKVPEARPGGKKARRDSDEEPTIARRTRSKLCLSGTPIESIEQSFVPPDELAAAPRDVDHLWSNFLEEMLDPTQTQNEEDDEADPEYNVAADPDADDEDEEALERSLVHISKKEIDDLFHELLCMSEEPAPPDPLAAPPPAVPGQQKATTEESQNQVTNRQKQINRLGENNMVEVSPRLPLPTPIKVEEIAESEESSSEEEGEEGKLQPPRILHDTILKHKKTEVMNIIVASTDGSVDETASEEAGPAQEERVRRPHVLRSLPLKPNIQNISVVLDCTQPVMEAMQVSLLQQQLRQHVQVATTNFMQLYAHPRLWTYAPIYKDYLTNLVKMADKQAESGQRSVVDVCNLRPALELLLSWEQVLSEDTPGNQEYIKFVEAESEKCMTRSSQNVVYVSKFPNMLMEAVSSSSVFVYPYLLPAVPYRCDSTRRSFYLQSEDCLIALGLQQFHEHVESNPEVYKAPKTGPTLTQLTMLIVQHMLPWLMPRKLRYHIHVLRKSKEYNPIREFFETKKLTPVQHKLLSFNPRLTLHEQPEYEMPLLWLKFLSKSNPRTKEYTMKKVRLRGHEPAGVNVDIESGTDVTTPTKRPIPTIQVPSAKIIIGPPTNPNGINNEHGIHTVQNNNLSILRTEDGGLLYPVVFVPQGGTVTPIPSTRIAEMHNVSILNESSITSTVIHESDHGKDVPPDLEGPVDSESLLHCKCCHLMRAMSEKWPLITNYFKPVGPVHESRECCAHRKRPTVSRRLKYFLFNYKLGSFSTWREFNSQLDDLKNFTSDRWNNGKDGSSTGITEFEDCDTSESLEKDDLDDRLWVCGYINRLSMRCPVKRVVRHQLYQMFKKFDLKTDCPLQLYETMVRRVGPGMADVASEFVGLLTATQAVRLGRYRDYFLYACLEPFLKLVREELRETCEAQRLEREVWAALAEEFGDACELCCRLLRLVPRHRRLAAFLLRATPHSLDAASSDTLTTKTSMVQKKKNSSSVDYRPILPKYPRGQPINELAPEQVDSGEPVASAAPTLPQTPPPPTTPLPSLTAPALEVDTPELTISKTEVEEPRDAPGAELRLKLEPAEWSREEDKILLEAIQQHTESGERTALELLDDEEIVASLQDSLVDKCHDDIRERIDYLLQLLCTDISSR